MSFSRPQQGKYRPVVKKAWLAYCEDTGTPPNSKPEYESWYGHHLQDCVGVRSTKDCDQVKDFDAAMLHFAILANDEYWMNRISNSDERRLFYQLRRYMADLEYLEKVAVDWTYIRGMWKQSRMLPEKMSNCPADKLRKLLAMLDTHIRRLCKAYGLKPSQLPTRTHPQADHPVSIDPENHYIHVGHDLDESHLPF